MNNCWPFRRTHERLQQDDGVELENGDAAAAAAKKKSGVDTWRRTWRVLKQVCGYLWPSGPGKWDIRIRVCVAVFCLIASNVLTSISPLLYKGCVDAISGASGRPYMPTALILGYGAVRLGSSFFSEARETVFIKVSCTALRMAGVDVFTHLHALPLDFHLQRKTGGILRALERGTNAIYALTAYTIFSIAPIFLQIGFALIVLLSLYHFIFAVVTIVTILVYVVFTVLVTEWRNRFRRAMNELDSESNDKAVDSLLNYETVKYFSNEDREVSRYADALLRYQNAAVRSQASVMLLDVGQSSIIGVGVTLVMLIAAAKVVKGQMTPGDFVLVNTYLLQLYLPLNSLGWVYRSMKQSIVDIEQMFDLLAQKSSVPDAADAIPLEIGANATIQFENVSFAYRPDVPILRNVSFTVPAGRTCAIVGPTGAGKSTIGRLIFRFYDVTGGRVLVGGQDVREVSQRSLRAAIGTVPQDTVLFNDTLEYNIKYGRMDASDADVASAARHAQIADFIASQPEGMATLVGERGLRLSGGEKQRVAIARAILKNPPLMIFDEATSALDSHTEKEIQGALRQVSLGRTTVMVAHRLSTVIDADEIIVLQDGVIAERGRHGELLALGGVYAGMWARQQEEAHQGAVAAAESAAGAGSGAVSAASASPSAAAAAAAAAAAWPGVEESSAVVVTTATATAPTVAPTAAVLDDADML